MNSLLLANLTKNLEEARKPVSLHSGVTKDILLGNLNYVFGFCNLYLNKKSFDCTNKITKTVSQEITVTISHQL